MLEPKIYKSNGLEALRLLGADGSEFFYEGRVDYSSDLVFKDDQGRAYYRVTTDLGKGMTYYVEVEPVGIQLPLVKKSQQPEKDISDLVVASPRDAESMPSKAMPSKETFSRPIEARPPEPQAEPVSSPTIPEEKPAESFGTDAKPAAPEESEIIAPTTDDEHEHAVEALSSIKHKKRPILKIALALVAIAIILLAVAGGFYLFKPDWVRSHVPFLATPTPTPTMTPTITATPQPTATPTPVPTAPTGAGLYGNLYAIGSAIHATNDSVVQFASNHTMTNTGSVNNNMTRTLDVFDYVNANWVTTASNATPDNASVIVGRLSGSDRDYSIAMAAIAEAFGQKARVVEAFYGDNATYYPEIVVASNDADYTGVVQYLKSRYVGIEPFGHAIGTQHWLSLAMGKTAGIQVNATYEYAVDSSSGITPLK